MSILDLGLQGGCLCPCHPGGHRRGRWRCGRWCCVTVRAPPEVVMGGGGVGAVGGAGAGDGARGHESGGCAGVRAEADDEEDSRPIGDTWSRDGGVTRSVICMTGRRITNISEELRDQI
jgi:hypothetical protein